MRPAGRRRVRGVRDELQKHRLELRRRNERLALREVPRQRAIRPRHAPHGLPLADDDVDDPHLSARPAIRRPLALRRRSARPDARRAASSIGFEAARGSADVGPGGVERELGAPEHDGHQVVDDVRDAAGEAADQLHLLGLPPPFLGGFLPEETQVLRRRPRRRGREGGARGRRSRRRAGAAPGRTDAARRGSAALRRRGRPTTASGLNARRLSGSSGTSRSGCGSRRNDAPA